MALWHQPRPDPPDEQSLVELMDETQRALRLRRALATRVTAQARATRDVLAEDLDAMQSDFEEWRRARR
jgi:hypothetical protein